MGLAQVDAKEAGQIADMLANGLGKACANGFGEARPPAEWRVLFLWSGEMRLGGRIAEKGRDGRIVAGHEIRIVDIPADAKPGYGLSETLHGFPSADAFARRLKMASGEH